MNKDIFNSIKTKNKIIFQAIAIMLLIAFICCNVYDDARMQEDYKDIKDEILQKHLKQPTDVTSNAKPKGLSPELKKKLFDTGIGYLEKDTTVEKLKAKILTKAHDNNFSKEALEHTALLNKLKGAYKEDFIHGNFKLEKIKLEAEEAIKAIPEDKLVYGVEPPLLPQAERPGDLKVQKETFTKELQEAYDSYFELLTLCMYSKPYHDDNKVAEGRIVDFFKGTPDNNGDSIVSVLEHIEAVKNRALDFKTCLSTPKASDNNGGANQVPQCTIEVEKKHPYPQQKRQNQQGRE
ncbi:hypothetical protein DB313_05055 (plasmid) [Borrelia turcica IST7]|uniref:Uncharacterized protein n=1 Tax=Borrelia turcica IST7 TaxID=1104446 RepID=A0A386PNM6_9SPIR|nr:hypothetical protein [Borrelia turcica]AYE36868.1 hypothetical protein DB313_05055 [Borrelia turcica IST7]